MKTVTIKIPDFVEMSETELRLMMASRLYEKGTITLGQAAEMCDITKREMMWKLGDYGVSYFNAPASDLINDVKNAAKHAINKDKG